MVFFTCNHCGSSLKKNKVEKHYAQECRKPPSVSCMDCLKDFYGEEYAKHTKCITEEQKYSGQPSNEVQVRKGEKKQIQWVETVHQIVDTKGSSLTPQERKLLENLKDFENIPRKKKKFENFLKNAMGRYIEPRTIEKIWSLLEEHKTQSSNKEQSDASKDHSSSEKTESAEVNEEVQPEPEAAEESSPKATTKLSKKEKKEKKKKQKYELELESISKEKQAVDDKNLEEEDMEVDLGETGGEEKGVKSKKNKKKKKDKEEDEPKTEENVNAPVINGTKGGEKKKGKRKHVDNEDEGGDRKKKKGVLEQKENAEEENGVAESGSTNGEVSEEVTKKGKFKWDKTILSVLKTAPENELPVKRLRKKVLSEYQEALGQGRCQELSLEEALGTFERKLLKIPGVKVLKEKAKLVKSS